MTSKPHYLADELDRLDDVHKLICRLRDIDPVSMDGRNLAAEIFAVSAKVSEEDDLLARFIH
jgi:hypothetical protein